MFIRGRAPTVCHSLFQFLCTAQEGQHLSFAMQLFPESVPESWLEEGTRMTIFHYFKCKAKYNEFQAYPKIAINLLKYHSTA